MTQTTTAGGGAMLTLTPWQTWATIVALFLLAGVLVLAAGWLWDRAAYRAADARERRAALRRVRGRR